MWTIQIFVADADLACGFFNHIGASEVRTETYFTENAKPQSKKHMLEMLSCSSLEQADHPKQWISCTGKWI